MYKLKILKQKFCLFDNIDIMKEVIIVGVNKYFGAYLNLIYNFRGI